MSSDPKNQFVVWHETPDGPLPVARVETGNLLGAAVLTVSRVDAHWQGNDGVTALVRDARSTDVGDVIVSPEGIAHQIAVTDSGVAFVPIDFPPSREYPVVLAAAASDQTRPRQSDSAAPLRDIFAARAGPSPPANDNHPDREPGYER